MSDPSARNADAPRLRPPPPGPTRPPAPPPYRPKPNMGMRGAPPGHGSRRSRCCRCCLFSLLFLLVLVVLAGAAVGIFYLVYRPQRPSLTLSSFTLNSLRVSDAGAVASSVDLTLSVKNPNEKVGFVLDDIWADASTASGIELASGWMSGFVSAPGNLTVLKAANMSAPAGDTVDPVQASQLQSSKKLAMAVKLSTKAGIQIGNFKSVKVRLVASCGGFSVASPAAAAAKSSNKLGKDKVLPLPAPAPTPEAATATGSTAAAAAVDAAGCDIGVKIWIWTL